jgi:hypothetical protein
MMAGTIDALRRLRDAHFTEEQAEAIIAAYEERFVTRDYLDARISGLLNDITWRLVALAVIVVTSVGLLDKLVRP